MNSASPLIPQGSNLEQQNKARSSLKVKIFCALGINVVVLLVLLMQGCKREQPQAVEDPYAAYNNTGVFTDTNPPAFEPDTNAAPVITDTNIAAQPSVPTDAYVPLTTPTVPVTPEVGLTEYTIQRGDTFSTIAPKFKVTVKALQQANPNVDPAKLQIGKKIMIPAPTTTAATVGTAPVVDTASGVTIHTVKSGETLSKLATDYHTTIKAIQAANGLSDSRIKVGQKLKIPAK
jgi:LysM repeat protein